MRKPEVDYRNFRLKKINEKEYCHLKLLFGWVVYFALFFLTERYIPAEKCHPVHMFLDDWIPFCEWFLIPYVFWYGLILFTLVWFARYNVQGFRAFQGYIMITQFLAIAIYILYPTRQDLRPEAFVRENFLTKGVSFLYSVDTSTGVCPSLHVAYSFGIFSVWSKEKTVSLWWKLFVLFAVVMICLSTVFIKQHSAVDFFAAIPVCLIAEGVIYLRKR